MRLWNTILSPCNVWPNIIQLRQQHIYKLCSILLVKSCKTKAKFNGLHHSHRADTLFFLLSGLLLLLICDTSPWSAEQYLQTQSCTEYTSGLLCRLTFYAALHFPIPACIYFSILFISFTVLNTETCVKSNYSISLCWIKFLQWLSWCWLIEVAPTLMKKM